jgi:hypothetical protein
MKGTTQEKIKVLRNKNMDYNKLYEQYQKLFEEN